MLPVLPRAITAFVIKICTMHTFSLYTYTYVVMCLQAREKALVSNSFQNLMQEEDQQP